MIRRQSSRTFAYFAIVILTAALGGILWPSGSPMVTASARAQDQLWQEITPGSLDALRNDQQSRLAPQHYKAFQLNEAALASLLADAPMEFTEAAKDPRNEITLPMPDGSFARFRFVESPIMEPELAARFPEIKTYRGWGIDDPAARTRFDRTGDGFHAIVFSPKGSSYVTPLSGGDRGTYASYFMRDAGGDAGVSCQAGSSDRVTDRPELNSLSQSALLSSGPPSNGDKLRTFQLAVAATGEYTNNFGGTVTGAMAAIATTVNNVNAIYQNELAVRFILIGANNSIIYTDTTTDPYTNGPPSVLQDENQENLESTIGEDNYDIGHVFDMNPQNSGRAERESVCDDGSKGRGASTLSNPTGVTFDLLVAHEIGHQLGATHTFNGTQGSCTDANRYEDTAYEPGSGSTLMSYQGICDSDDIPPSLDASMNIIPYFHGASLAQIVRHLDGSGDCATTSFNNNTPPNVIPPTPAFPTPLGHYLIPKQTPFTLTASATDAEDPNITFCWEELDHGSPGPPSGDRGDNPLFRSDAPTMNPTRTFPRMSDVLGLTTTKGETLPTTQRSMGFRVTARDNHSTGGGFDQGDVVVDVWASAGPFVVTEPAAGAEALEGRSLIVRWDVAGTAGQAINAANVRILLSTDNGATFPTTLAASTQNDGSFSFTVPRASTQQARIKVGAINNIFFNVSPAFTIIAKPTITATGNLTVTEGSPSAPAPVATVADERDAAGSLMVATTTSPLPTGVTLSFTNENGVVSATATAQCISFEGAHPITLQVTNSAGLSASTTFNLTVDPNLSPILGNYSDATVVAGQSITVSPSAPPSDPNSNLGSITASILAPTPVPGSATLQVNQTSGVVTIFTSGALQLGIHQIRVQATDSCGFTARKEFFLTGANSPPQVVSLGNSVMTTKGGTSSSPIAVATASDRQDAAGALGVSAAAPPGITVTVTNSNGTINAIATATCAVEPGTYTATLTVTDSSAATESVTFPVNVNPNPPPTLGTYLNSGVTVGVTVDIVPNAPPSDPNNAVFVSVTPMVLPGGGLVSVNPTNGWVRVQTFASTNLGAYVVKVTVTDACGAQVSRSFNLTVRSATCATAQSASFAADTGNHRIQRFNGANWAVIGAGTPGSGLGQFTSPEAVVASGNGQRIYVADTGNSRIQWSQNSGGTWAVFASNLTPQGLALDRDGNLYVSDAQDNRVLRYIGGVPGTPIVLATSGSGSGRVSNPNGLAIDCRMTLYIADTGNNRILAIATADAAVIPNTGAVVAGSGVGLNPAQVTAPQGVAVDNAGRLYVADTGNNRVLAMATAPLPGPAAALCTLGPALGQVSGPEGVTIAAFAFGPLAGVSSIIVSDTTNNRIQGKSLPAGAWMLLPPPAGGGPGAGIGQFKLPSKIR